MSTLRIYDTKGNAYSPDGTATGSDEQIKELFYGGVRLAIRSDHRREISLFFRARESRNARTEQFYAVYSVDNSTAPLQDLISDLTTRIESEWGYTIDESSDEMQVYRELKRGNTAVPGDSTEQDILAELITSRNSVTVGVSDERNAIGLLSEYLGQYDQAAVADSTDADVLSTFDLVVSFAPGQAHQTGDRVDPRVGRDAFARLWPLERRNSEPCSGECAGTQIANPRLHASITIKRLH
jgi:hypothetical protein